MIHLNIVHPLTSWRHKIHRILFWINERCQAFKKKDFNYLLLRCWFFSIQIHNKDFVVYTFNFIWITLSSTDEHAGSDNAGVIRYMQMNTSLQIPNCKWTELTVAN
jgi:hypothetical protein